METRGSIRYAIRVMRRAPLFKATVFAVAALVLLGIGLVGLLTFCAQQRTTEIGVRLALAAFIPAWRAARLDPVVALRQE